MKKSIEQILNTIPKGMIFDSHYIVSQLMKHHSDNYLSFASKFNSGNKITNTTHMQIGKEVAKFEDDVITRKENMSWSENIHGNSSECTAWRKL